MLSLVVMGTDEANGVLFNSLKKKKRNRGWERLRHLPRSYSLDVGSQEEL